MVVVTVTALAPGSIVGVTEAAVIAAPGVAVIEEDGIVTDVMKVLPTAVASVLGVTAVLVAYGGVKVEAVDMTTQDAVVVEDGASDAPTIAPREVSAGLRFGSGVVIETSSGVVDGIDKGVKWEMP